MKNNSIRYRALALAAALAVPGLALAQQAPSRALEAFTAQALAQGLSAADVANPLVTNSYTEVGGGITHTYLLQRVNGVPVFGATGAVHTNPNGAVMASYQEFVAGAARSAPSAQPTLGPADAVVAASTALGLGRPTGLAQVDAPNTQGIITFNGGGIAQDNIPVQLMYARTATGLVLVWNVTIAQNNQEHYWNARVDAHTGQLIDKNDFTVSEQNHRAAAPRKASLAQQALNFAQVAAPLSPTSTTAAGAVTVVALPLESPTQGARTDVTLPALGNTYSPYGWAVGQSFTTFSAAYSQQASGKYLTRGNNVAAYDDNSATANGATAANFNSSTTSPDGGSTLNYGFPFTQTLGPRDAGNLSSSITNLFYINNMMHDVMMAHGFDEVSGNFQFKNATNTGAGNDPVRAEAQDGYARNNANFSTPVDGAMPTMQMYLWDNVDQSLTITAPASIAGRYNYAPTTNFGGDLSLIGSVCGSIVPVNDGTTVDGGVHGCGQTYVNAGAVSGNIALIERRGCSITANNTFVAKVKNAQLNGATLAIVFGNIANSDTLVTMSGTDPSITIPAIFISGRDGAKIRAALTGTTTATGCVNSTTGADWDGSFDNGVVSHEYGHGISNRITGGPSNSSCVTQSYSSGGTTKYTQCMGEGWSDFFGLWMTTKPGEDGGRARGIGNYVIGEDPNTGTGIRSYPYSTNMSINPLTYANLGQGIYTETHNLGEIWTAMLWDLNWQFIAKYGYNANTYASTGGNNVCLKLVLDAMRYQICNPSFLAGRNAILKADSINNGGANRALIWTVFARRGLGYSATGGDRANNLPLLTNITPATNMPPGLTAVPLFTRSATNAGTLEAYPNPAQNRLTIRSQAAGTAPARITLYDVLGKAVLAPMSVPAAQLQQAGAELDTSTLANGIYIVHVATTEGNFTTRVTVQH